MIVIPVCLCLLFSIWLHLAKSAPNVAVEPNVAYAPELPFLDVKDPAPELVQATIAQAAIVEPVVNQALSTAPPPSG